MESNEFVNLGDFCNYHHVSYTFISGLHDAGLVEITVLDNNQLLNVAQLKELEMMVRLHNELDINSEGIEVVAHLLHKLNELQHELKTVKRRLSWYESHY